MQQARKITLGLAERGLWSEDECAAYAHVSRTTFRLWVDKGLLVKVRLPFVGKRNLYRPADVERFVAGLADSRAAVEP